MKAPTRSAAEKGKLREEFWTSVTVVPAAMCVIRLWVEAGGELQITLALVSQVGPLNLAAAMFASVTSAVTTLALVALVLGRILNVTDGRDTHWLARVAAAARPWAIATLFVFAFLSWQLLYLPMLLPIAVAIRQRPLWRLFGDGPRGWGYLVLFLAGYAGLLGPTAYYATRHDEWLVTLLLAVPLAGAFLINGPLPRSLGGLVGVTATIALLAVSGYLMYSASRIPILPSVIITAGDTDHPEYLRASLVEINDVFVVILQEGGSLRYLDAETVRSATLCQTPEQMPTYTARIWGYHVEDSVLGAIGRERRPRSHVDPLCRVVGVTADAADDTDGRPHAYPGGRIR